MRMLRLRPKSRAYLPRTPAVKSYSGSMSSASFRTISFFLISFPFPARSGARADNPDCRIGVDMHHDEQLESIRHADGNESVLFRRMRTVRNGGLRPVAEDFNGLNKRHAVLPTIGSGFHLIPLKRLHYTRCSCTSGLDASSPSPIVTNDRKRAVNSPASR